MKTKIKIMIGVIIFLVVAGGVSTAIYLVMRNQSPNCLPYCESRQCGPNGCGGSCGKCDLGLICDESQKCVGDGEVEQKYKIKFSAKGNGCDFKNVPIIYLGLTKNMMVKLDVKVDTVWILDSLGYLYTIVNNTKVYLSSKRTSVNIKDKWIYENVTQDKSQALKLDKQSLIKNKYVPLFTPVIYQENGLPRVSLGGSSDSRPLFFQGTCKGYTRFIFEKVPTS